MFASFWARARPTLGLALPIIAGQVSQMLMGLIDSAMVGRVGVVPLAGAAFANTLISIPLVFGIGLMLALGIRVSQARGADDGASNSASNGENHAPLEVGEVEVEARQNSAGNSSADDTDSASIGELLRHGMFLALGAGIVLALGVAPVRRISRPLRPSRKRGARGASVSLVGGRLAAVCVADFRAEKLLRGAGKTPGRRR